MHPTSGMEELPCQGGIGCVSPMIAVLLALFASLRAAFQSRIALHLEILALRHQLSVYQRQPRRVRTSRGAGVEQR